MKKLLKLNLQLFADGDGDGGQAGGDQSGDDSAATAQNGDTNQDGNQSDSDENKPFKSFTSEKELQSYTDKLIATALKTHDEKKATDAQKEKDISKMSDLEKANYEKDELTKQLADAKRHGNIVENRSKITEKLGADNLPVGLVSVFGESVLADDDGLDEAYKNVSKVFTDSLQKAIDKRIADSSTTPLAGTGSSKKSEGASVADQLNKNQQAGKSSIWDTK
ncbi:capsid assembly scaffolding protein Gp46 family protein [Lactiplantibacillus paraxiangfangensis]|uniref:capsid assembly scaffolding protein Gp46 family protein n=1 Tax=Lactiplantibacillus paraxiangfangensis TaxID=3076224 RepID=UPI0030C6A26B